MRLGSRRRTCSGSARTIPAPAARLRRRPSCERPGSGSEMGRFRVRSWKRSGPISTNGSCAGSSGSPTRSLRGAGGRSWTRSAQGTRGSRWSRACLTAAIEERRPPPRWLAAMREGTADDAPGPLNVLASLLHPQSVWSIDETRAAQTLSAPLGPLATKLAVIASFARAETEATAARAAPRRGRARARAPSGRRGAADDGRPGRGMPTRRNRRGGRRRDVHAHVAHVRHEPRGARDGGAVAELRMLHLDAMMPLCRSSVRPSRSMSACSVPFA